MNATATAPARQRKPRTKPARFVRLTIRPEGKSPGVLHLTVGKEAADYFLTAVPADFGRGFKVEKIGLDATEPGYARQHRRRQEDVRVQGLLAVTGTASTRTASRP